MPRRIESSGVQPTQTATPSAEVVEQWKARAAAKAVEQVQSGMRVGLGTGSTTNYAIDLIAQKVRSGELTDLVGVSSSVKTEERARSGGIPLSTLNETPRLDIAIDGADQVWFDGDNLFLIKGGGGAHLREKENAQAAQRFVAIVDGTKVVGQRDFGSKFPLPVEIDRNRWEEAAAVLRQMGGEPVLRRQKDSDQPFVTDNGNYILDVRFDGGIRNPFGLERAIEQRVPGFEAHGLFLNMAAEVIVADASGVKSLKRPEGRREDARDGFRAREDRRGPALDGRPRREEPPPQRRDALGYVQEREHATGEMRGEQLPAIDPNEIANLSGDALLQYLRERCDGLSTLDYRDARYFMFTFVDNENGVVEDVYTGRQARVNGIPDADRGVAMNTEHTLPQSFLKRAGKNAGVSDLAHLFPTDTKANNVRGSLPFGIVEQAQWEQNGSKMGLDANGRRVFEPRDEQKGPTARAMFAASKRWNMKIPAHEEAVLKAWHKQFPVTDDERARNERMAQVQGNRNDFVDHPELVDRIDDF